MFVGFWGIIRDFYPNLFLFFDGLPKVGNDIYISGGESVYNPGMQEYENKHDILLWEPDMEEEEEVVGAWVEVSKMKIARNFHGMAAVPVEFVTKYCDVETEH